METGDKMTREYEEISMDPQAILKNPAVNKGTAFTYEERKSLGLLGLLPYVISNIDEQVQRRYQNFHDQKDEYAKYRMLKNLRERNQVLYFKLLETYPEELLPYVYTPLVGEAAIKFSHYFTQTRGVYFSYPYKDEVDAIVDSIPNFAIQAIVITDGSRILGLGDMGAGGMAIPIGKLDLYTVFAGIDPQKVLPVQIDVGTNNEKLLNDPLYIGWKHKRIEGDEYFHFVEKIVNALKKRYPHVLLQWEDFSKDNARFLLSHFHDKICSFNDDIQGTAASVLAALTTAIKIAKAKFSQQRIAILGGGSAGIGIADLLVKAMVLEGMSEHEAKDLIYIVDIDGLLLSENTKLDSEQKAFARPYSKVEHFDTHKEGKITLLDVARHAKPTILIGVSAQAGAFTEEIIKEMNKSTSHPIIMPLSNPTSKSEATPEDLLKWTHGRALIATGSPFKPVEYQGKTYHISQCNNVYVFPGLGLGVIATESKIVTTEMFLKAVDVLSNYTMKYSDGRLFPKFSELRKVSQMIGVEVAKLATISGLSRTKSDQTPEHLVEKMMWSARYKEYRKKKKH